MICTSLLPHSQFASSLQLHIKLLSKGWCNLNWLKTQTSFLVLCHSIGQPKENGAKSTIQPGICCRRNVTFHLRILRKTEAVEDSPSLHHRNGSKERENFDADSGLGFFSILHLHCFLVMCILPGRQGNYKTNQRVNEFYGNEICNFKIVEVERILRRPLWVFLLLYLISVLLQWSMWKRIPHLSC